MFDSLYRWYLQTFLPFEQPDHPLYHDQAAVEAAEAELQEIWDEIEREDAEYQARFTVSSDPTTTHYL